MSAPHAAAPAGTEHSAPADDAGPSGDPVRTSPLTEVLFDGRFDDLHRPWTDILDRDIFRHREGLSPAERSELAYERLRVLNAHIPSVAEMVATTERLVALHEWLGPVDGSLTTLATIHYNLFLGSLLRLDPQGTTDRTPYTRLDRYGTALITELGYGNNAARLETTATYRPETDTFILHTPTCGAQKFMPNTGPAGGPKSALVAARLIVADEDRGVFLFLVPLRDNGGPLPGIRVRLLSGTPGSAVDHAITSFGRLELPRTALLTGDHAELTPDGTFHSPVGSRRARFLRSIQRVTTGKLCLSAAVLGGARAALTVAVRYSHRRHTQAPATRTEIPVFAYRCNQTRLLGATARAYAATFLLREATRLFARQDATAPGAATEPDAAADVLVAVAKGWITWQARDIVLECRERCGAQGLLSANRVVDLITPIEGAVTAEGDNLVIWQKAATDMLAGRGYTPPATPPAGGGPLTDPALLHDLLVHHELACLRTAHRRLARPAADLMDGWNHTVNAALDLVDAHATRRAAAALRAAAAHDPGNLLDQVFQLFALQRLAPHTGTLLADGHLSADQVRELNGTVDRVAARLAPHALTLVSAFAIPDAILQAPIATDTYTPTYDDPEGPWQPRPAPR